MPVPETTAPALPAENNGLRMRSSRVMLFILLWMLCLLLAPGLVFAQTAHNPRILDFTCRVAIQPDSSILVTETIRLHNAGPRLKHGIVRDFPTKYHDKQGEEYTVGFHVLRVERNGAPESRRFLPAKNGLRIVLGEKNAPLATGEHTYVIQYETNRQIGFFSDYDSLLWNVVGQGWKLPILKAYATIILPEGTKILSTKATAGGSIQASSRVSSPREAFFSINSPLPPGQAFTIGATWAKGVVEAPGLLTLTRFALQDHPGLAVALLGGCTLILYYALAWFFVGRGPRKGVIIPLFAPPDELSPPAVRFLYKSMYDAKAFASAIVDLAVGGVLRIEDNRPGGFWLHELSYPTDKTPQEEAKVARRLFMSGEQVAIHKEQGGIIASASNSLRAELERRFIRTLIQTNRPYILMGLAVNLGIITAVALASRSVETSFYGFGVLFLGSLMTRVVLKKTLQRHIRSQVLRALLTGIVFILLIVGLFFFFSFKVTLEGFLLSTSPAALLVLLSTLAVHLPFVIWLRAPTYLGRRVLDQILGFRAFLAVTEKERLSVMHPPLMTVELYERFLPYAIALDAEAAWSKRLADALVEAENIDAAALYEPQWLEGGDWDSQLFLDAHLDFCDSFTQAMDVAISSSSSFPGSTSGRHFDVDSGGGEYGAGVDSLSSGDGFDAGDGGGGGGGDGW